MLRVYGLRVGVYGREFRASGAIAHMLAGRAARGSRSDLSLKHHGMMALLHANDDITARK